MIKIAVDMMGSDLGPSELSKGLLNYLKDNKDVAFVCFGEKKQLSQLEGNSHIDIVDCPDVVPMEVGVLQLLKMKDSSMVRAIKYTQENNLDGVVTAGSTGGFITGSTLIFKNVAGVNRAGFCAPFMTAKKDKQVLILDIGASNSNTAEELVGFARLGSIYAEALLKESNPSVYLLSNGSEEGKGTEEIKEAYKLMKGSQQVNFLGNIEARDALDGRCDVVVTSGYPGNIFLKATEGCASMMNTMIKSAFKRNLFSKIGYLLSKKGFNEMKEHMDYRKIGGAILLGVNKAAVKAHGNSNAYAFYYAIDLAYRLAKNEIVDKITKEFRN